MLVNEAPEDTEQILKVEDLSIFGSSQMHPIIFEECYLKETDHRFIQIVK
jgi:hypothetical protein